MSKSFGTYGSATDSVDAVMSVLSEALDVQFEARVSDYLGEYQLWCSDTGDEVKVLANDEPDEEGYILSERHAGYRTLVEIESMDIGDLRDRIERLGTLVWLGE